MLWDSNTAMRLAKVRSQKRRLRKVTALISIYEYLIDALEQKTNLQARNRKEKGKSTSGQEAKQAKPDSEHHENVHAPGEVGDPG